MCSRLACLSAFGFILVSLRNFFGFILGSIWFRFGFVVVSFWCRIISFCCGYHGFRYWCLFNSLLTWARSHLLDYNAGRQSKGGNATTCPTVNVDKTAGFDIRSPIREIDNCEGAIISSLGSLASRMCITVRRVGRVSHA